MERRTKARDTSCDLFTADRKRKYLTAEERGRFLEAAQEHLRGEVPSFCELLAYMGCRITGALALTPASVDISARGIIFRTLKQRNAQRYRTVPIRESRIDMIDLVHGSATATVIPRRSTWTRSGKKDVERPNYGYYG